jgi:hypothetical protein
MTKTKRIFNFGPTPMNGNGNGFLSLDWFDNVLFIKLLVVTCAKR